MGNFGNLIGPGTLSVDTQFYSPFANVNRNIYPAGSAYEL